MYENDGIKDAVKSNMAVEDVERRPEEMQNAGDGI